MDGGAGKKAVGSGTAGERTTQTIQSLRRRAGYELEVEAALRLAAAGAATHRAQRMAAVERAGDRTFLYSSGYDGQKICDVHASSEEVSEEERRW